MGPWVPAKRLSAVAIGVAIDVAIAPRRWAPCARSLPGGQLPRPAAVQTRRSGSRAVRGMAVRGMAVRPQPRRDGSGEGAPFNPIRRCARCNRAAIGNARASETTQKPPQKPPQVQPRGRGRKATGGNWAGVENWTDGANWWGESVGASDGPGGASLAMRTWRRRFANTFGAIACFASL